MSRLLLIFALTAFALACDAPSPGLQPGEHHVVVDGVRLTYSVAGVPAGGHAPVVFLHGGPGYNSHSFAVQAGPGLEPALPMVYLDQRGAGRSERPWTQDYSMDRLVADLEALRQHWAAPTLRLIGHSFGGALALEYAARYPERVERIVLVGPLSDASASMDGWVDRLAAWAPDVWAEAQTLPGPAADRIMAATARAGGQAFFTRMQFPDSVLSVELAALDAASGLRNTGELSGALFREGLAQYRFTATDRVTMPVLVIGGPFDYAIGLGTMEDLSTRLPLGSIVTYDGAGHFPYLDAPDRFSRDVTTFLAAPQDQRVGAPAVVAAADTTWSTRVR